MSAEGTLAADAALRTGVNTRVVRTAGKGYPVTAVADEVAGHRDSLSIIQQ
jgi:hypothetical protein